MQFIDEMLDEAWVAIKNGNTPKAEHLCSAVLKQVQHPQALHILAVVRNSQKRWAESIKLFEKAQQIGGENSQNCLFRANMLLSLHENDPLAVPNGLSQVEKLLRRAVELDPNAPAPRGWFADMLNKMGRTEEAIDVLRPMLERRPVPAIILFAYARLAPKLNEMDTAISYLEAALSASPHSSSDEYTILYSQAGLYDRQGDYHRAFAAMKRANDLLHADSPAPNFERLVDAIVEVFSLDAVDALPRAETDSKLPIFIVGLPRSGTSLVEEILASHSRVFAAGEIKNILQTVEDLPRHTQGYSYPEAVSHLDSAIIDQLSRQYIEYLGKLGGNAERVTDKQTTNFIHLGLIAMLTPNAPILNCYRNILDNCVSMFFQDFCISPYYVKTFDSLAHFCRGYMRLMDHWREVLDLRILDVEYEKLVEQPETTVRGVLEFLNLPWDDNCLHFYKSDRFVHTASRDQVRQPIYKESIGRWRNYEDHFDPLRKLLGS